MGVGLREDGTLRVVYMWRTKNVDSRWQLAIEGADIQLGREAHWLALAGGNGRPVVALKADGTLWHWQFQKDPKIYPESARAIPMGSHSDWVGLADGSEGVFSLAADGSLWEWDLMPEGFGASRRATALIQLAPSRYPRRLVSIQD